MFDIKKDLEARIERTEKLLQRLRDTVEFAEKEDYFFRVTIISAWSDYGEKSAVGTGHSAESAMEDAKKKFKEINSRSDVQASHITTVVVFPNEFTFQPHGVY